MKKNYYNYVGIYTFTYAALGVVLPLIGQYLDSIGFSGAQIGTITASATVMGMFASPFWAKIFHKDRKYEGNLTVFVLCILAAFTSIGIMSVKQYGIFLLTYILLSFFQMPIMPLTDALILNVGHSFGNTRKWGAIGFALGVLISGQIAEILGLTIIFPLYSVAFFITAIIIINIIKKNKNTVSIVRINKDCTYFGETKDNIQSSETTETLELHKVGYLSLLKNKKLMQLLLCAFFLCGTNVANNTYFGFLYIDTGGTVAGIGFAFLLMAGSEAPFMAFCDKLSNKFTLEKVLLIAMIISAARFIWYSSHPPYWFILGMFFLQGMVNGIILVEFVRYIAKIVNPEIICMAMALYQAVSSNCSTIVCQLFGGIIMDIYNSSAVYLFFGLYNVIGIILYLSFGLQKEYLIENKIK
ncbi:MFS transporter [Anaerovorax odorimutans]|uniref:MFS transporter n=1 Tax=Anaerovorax odorimutans TaxID=109327 RepID=UPI0004124BA9|nr:MFS transporter [Anaerovorax odorimutans]